MKISFLASHGGTATRQIYQAIEVGELGASLGVVITNNRDSEIYDWCCEHALSVHHISGRTHPDDDEKDLAILKVLDDAGTDLVVLSGYMKKIGWRTLSQYQERILNIHPSLLPRHGGRGMYGDHVHYSVLRSGDSESGATVHLIDEEYDEGPVIAQRKVPVGPDDNLESLKAKVQALEGPLYIEAISSIMRKKKAPPSVRRSVR